GSGLFLASGQAMKLAGPALAFSYLIGATVMAVEISALAEMAASDPVEGSFLVYARRALGPGWTFVGGWVFWFSSVLNLAAEATAAAIFTALWLPHLPTWIVSTLFALAIVGINFLTVRGFGAIESAMAAVKLIAVTLFVLLFGAVIFLH
ncbi:amino acid permease-associated region, partial [mine drainage metagenome]